MKTTAFCDIAPCRLVGVDRRFVTPRMESICTSETTVYSDSTWCNIPERFHLQFQFQFTYKNINYINYKKVPSLITQQFKFSFVKFLIVWTRKQCTTLWRSAVFTYRSAIFNMFNLFIKLFGDCLHIRFDNERPMSAFLNLFTLEETLK